MQSPTLEPRGLALWEIVSVVTSALIVEWVVLSFVGDNKLISAIPILLACGLIVFSSRERGETLREIGFRTDNFLSSCRLLLLPTAAAIIVIVVICWFTNHLIAAPFRARYFSLPLWALFQQYALNGFVNRRAQLALGRGLKSIALVAVIFGLLHLPNPLLTMVTIIGGLILAAVYQRQPNLFALALSHTLVSLTLALVTPPDLFNSLRVGLKYFS